MSDTQNSEIKPAKEEQSVHETPANKIVERDAEAGLAKEARPSARLLPMWILIAAVIVVGVAWALSDRYFGTSEMDESDVPLVTAEKAPIKVKPKKPGGIDVPDRDKYVYKSLTGEEPDAEELLPPPEEPMELTSAVADEGVDALEAAEIAEAVEISRSISETDMQSVPDAMSPDEVSLADPKMLVSEPEDILLRTLPKEGESVAGVGEPKAMGDSLAVLAEQTTDTKPELASSLEPELAPKQIGSGPAIVPVKPTALSVDTPGFLVQVGATQKQDLAAGEIARLANKHSEILSGVGSVVVRVDLGDKGVWYRMRVGPFDTRAAAEDTCGKLKAVNVGCFVVAN